MTLISKVNVFFNIFFYLPLFTCIKKPSTKEVKCPGLESFLGEAGNQHIFADGTPIIFFKTSMTISNKKTSDCLRFFRARDWNRTSTSLRTADFESAASTNSATRAKNRAAILSHSSQLLPNAIQIFFLIIILLYLQQLFFGSNTLFIIFNDIFNRFINFIL